MANAFPFLPPVQIHIPGRSRRFRLGDSTGYNIHPAVETWAAQVVTQGGAAVSLYTKWNLSVFYNGLVGTGLLSDMLEVNCIVPDSFIACRVPLIKTSGSTIWSASNFQANELTMNGLMTTCVQNNPKFLNTGFLGTSFASDGNAGISEYTTIVPGTFLNGSNNYDYGYTNNAGTECFLATQYQSGGNPKPLGGVFDANAGQGVINGPSTLTRSGFFSINRTASNACAMYTGNSVSGFVTQATTATSQTGTRQAAAIYMNGINATDQGNICILSSGQCFGFFAIHNGLNSTKAQNLYNLVQTMRFNYGGAI